jgi:hypothetical protein
MYYIGNFQHFTDQEQERIEDRRHGEFTMMVEARSANQALEKFRRQLMAFRTTSTFFTGKCKIYISQMLEFQQVPDQEAVLLNLKSYAGDPLMPFISCVVPTDQSDACSIHDWRQNRPTTEGQPDGLLIQFDAE